MCTVVPNAADLFRGGVTVQESESRKDLSWGSPDECTRGGGRILVMDDEAAIRTLTQRMLSMVGYDVAVTSNGEETIESYKQAAASGRSFDAVILDLTIRGGKGGAETASELLTMDADAAIIISSGYPNDPAMQQLMGIGSIALIPKPYLLHEMLAALKRVVSQRHRRLGTQAQPE